MAQRIVFPGRDQVETEEFDLGPLAGDSVRLRTRHSLMSTGTEGIVLHGLFDEGTHWAEFVRYPFHPGYSAVGTVEEIGREVEDIAVGDVVAARVGHASEHVVPARMCTRVPDDLPSDLASWFGLAKIALMGARAADYRLGDTVAVVGAGPIGQMSVRWAVAAGAVRVVVVDTVPQRLKAALVGGATDVVAAALPEAVDDVVAACGGVKPRVVVDSTGNAIAFAAALGLAADRGRVILLGDTGSPASQHLTPDVVTRGITIVGAHDSHSMADHAWDGDHSMHELFFHLARTDRFSLTGLNLHTFRPQDCAAAYRVASERRGDTMGIVFDWTEL